MYHVTNLGSHGNNVPRDLDGYVPEEGDSDPWAFRVDHGAEATHDDTGALTEYGEWWEDEGYPEWRDAAVAATKVAERALAEWQSEVAS